MANTITSLVPDAYAALDVVSRELVGFIPSVSRDASVDRIAKGQSVRTDVTPANTAGGDVTAAMARPAAADQAIGNASVTITKSRFFPFSWSGEQQYDVDQGPGYLTVKQNQIAQAIRACCNEIENDIADAIAINSSRAYGTAGATPFASNLGDSAQLRKILDDNGAPASARSLIINTSAGAALRTLAQLTKANEAGTQMTLRDGELLNLHGFAIKESAQINTNAAGTGASYVLNGAHAAGATSIVLKTGTGTVLAGDVITIGSYKYVVKTGVAAAGTIVINGPGLQAAGSDGDTVTVNAVSARNVGFSQNAIVLAARLPVTPKEGDLAIMREIITDPRSGLSFEIVAYPGYDMVTYHVRAAWGVSVIKPEHTAILLG